MSQEQIDHWDQAMRAFDHEQFLDSIEHFLLSLMQPEEDTVRYSRTESGISFTLCQGSRVVYGEADLKWFRATAEIILCDLPNIGLFRRLLESSYKLMYGRYAQLENNNIAILFDGYLQEASPYKLLYGLKEIALRADKEDDLLSAEFTQVGRIPSPYVKVIPDEEKSIKYRYYRQWLEYALSPEPFGQLNKAKYPGASVYVYLSALYKIDYLLHPEGRIMEIIETAHKNYFSREEVDLNNKVAALEKVCRQLLQIPEESVKSEMYLVEHIFPITSLITTRDLAEHIDTEMQAMVWYQDNEHTGICKAICDYIATNCFFNYTLPTVSHALLHQYFVMSEPDFFKALGFKIRYDPFKNLQGSVRQLSNDLKKIIESHLGAQEGLDNILIFDDSGEVEWRISLIRLIQNFQYNA